MTAMRFKKSSRRDTVGTPAEDSAPIDEDSLADDEPKCAAGPVTCSNAGARIAVFGVLPAVLIAMAIGAGYLKWQQATDRASEVAGIESLQAARDTAVALLSYQADDAERELDAATGRMTGSFKDEYRDLIAKVVIPGARDKQISASATVPSAAVESATSTHAVVLLFINQTTTIGATSPTEMLSSVRVSMDKVGDRWLMSGFGPI